MCPPLACGSQRLLPCSGQERGVVSQFEFRLSTHGGLCSAGWLVPEADIPRGPAPARKRPYRSFTPCFMMRLRSGQPLIDSEQNFPSGAAPATFAAPPRLDRSTVAIASILVGDEPFRDMRLNARPLLRLQPPRRSASREACPSMKNAIGTLGRCLSELDISRRRLTVLSWMPSGGKRKKFELPWREYGPF
jgi:hypothetical protein